MTLISFENVSKEYSNTRILDSCSFEIKEGGRYGLIGPNGAGKSTILRIIQGLEVEDSGSCVVAGGCRLGFVPQFLGDVSSTSGASPKKATSASDPASTATSTSAPLNAPAPTSNPTSARATVREFLLEHIHPLEKELHKYEELLQDPVNVEKNLLAYERAREAFEGAGGYSAENEVNKYLEQFGLSRALHQTIASLSGGEQSMVGLVKALIFAPSVLVLDEPDNHLDYHALAWLEMFLVQFRGTVLIVSHNRYVLDRVCTDILELSQGRVRHFVGNYSDYKLKKLSNAISQQESYSASQKKIEQIQKMVRRFEVIAASRPDPSWGKRLRAARSRLKQENERAVEKVHLEHQHIKADIASKAQQGDLAIQITDLNLSIGGVGAVGDVGAASGDGASTQLLRSASLTVNRGRKIALVGPNSSGKTTLLNALHRHGAWDHPNLRIVDSLTRGYIRQRAVFENWNRSMEDEVRSWGPISKSQAFALLSAMNFQFKELEKRLSVLSGGEVNRLQIAKMIYEKPDILIMDEPTNYLDIPSREAFEEALSDFQGTILVVSHDRYFLDTLVDGIAEIHNGLIELFNGTFTEYYHHRGSAMNSLMKPRMKSKGNISSRSKERGRALKNNESDVSAQEAPTSRRSQKRSQADVSAKGKPSAPSPKIEERIDRLEAEKADLERKLESAFAQNNYQLGRELSKKINKTQHIIDELYSRWEAGES